MSADTGHRKTATEQTDRSLLVEASAGTGKTKTLVDRILTLVLSGEEEGGIPITNLAALTFTEKAAGEMKDRLRGELERESRGGGPRAARAVRALDAIDLAEISTIHAFCARLLRERPVDAGVDPDFTTPQPAAVRELVAEAFAEWFDAEARAEEGPLLDALGEGLLPDALGELAGALYGRRATLEGSSVPQDALEEARERLAELAGGFRALLAEAPGWKRAGEMAALVDELDALARLDLPSLAAARPDAGFQLYGAPKDPDWSVRAKALRKAWEKLRDSLPHLRERILLARLVNRMRASLFPAVEAKKRERGFLDFDDLLLLTRDVLRKSEAVREHFGERFRALLVDEFQDTDPVQAEIVLRLSSPPGDARPWEELEISGGELFVVGDPKQSIYRFRNADVETYAKVKALFPQEARLTLSSSWRSDPRLVAWVNRVFRDVLVTHPGRPWETEYAELQPEREVEGEEPPVTYLLPPQDLEKLSLPELREREAAAVANLLKDRFGKRGTWRGIGILVAKNEAIDTMESALRAAGIPSMAEGGKSYTAREETGAVVAALRAIADPGDGVALVAALKSFLFAASDVDLVEAAERGFRFDVAGEAPAGTAVAPAVALIQKLRARRHHRPAAETLLELLTARSAFAALSAGAAGNPRQAVANVERLVASARALDAEELSFREAVGTLHGSLDEDAPEPRAFEEHEDAVKILTLHKSKGLEFDVVVLAGLGLADRERARLRATVCFDRPGGLVGAKLSLDDVTVTTPRWEEVLAAEGQRLGAEDRRLLYVGATRAKRRLVLSWWAGSKKDGDTLGTSYLARMDIARDVSLFPPGTVEEVVSVLREPAGAPEEPAEPADPAPAMRAADARLDKARGTASRPLRRAGEHEFVPVRAEDVSASDRENEDVSDRALRIGVAVHRAMELLLDPSRPEPPLDDALDAAGADLPAGARSEVRRLVTRLLDDEVTERARHARRRFVEVPLLFRDGDGPEAPLVEGKIDLLFEEEDGLVVVDWKTDRVDSPEVLAERRDLYATQLQAYADGLQKALGAGTRIKETRLVFARG